jgi:cellulose synthase/poly-beta-1,6-N-acetylglucosamine synthase-like glycosyltransferase
MAKLLFWVSAGFAIYVYAGYPILLWILRFVSGSSPSRQPVEPSVSLLVAAYNEAAIIGDKIRNSLAIEYPVDKLEVVIASDGSKDATAEIVRSLAASDVGARIRLFDFQENRGKTALLNVVVPELQAEIVAFSDASSMLEANSIRNLVQSFSDLRVGAASGVYRLLKKDHPP